MTYTPGPWKIGEKGKYHKQHYRELTGERLPIYSNHICWILNDVDETEPNAALIAAAPDLVEVCNTVIDSFIPEDEQNDGDPLFEDAKVFDAYELAKQTLAKAGVK